MSRRCYGLRASHVTAEDVAQWILAINESDLPILVEGHNDRKALRNAGVKNLIVQVYTQPCYKTVEFISSHFKACIILTDNDREGRKLFAHFNSELCQRGVRVDVKLREFFLRTELNQLEGLGAYLKRLARRDSIF